MYWINVFRRWNFISLDTLKCLLKISTGNNKKYTYRVHKIKTITVDWKWLLTLKSLDFSYGNLKWFETQKAFRVIVPNVQRLFKKINVLHSDSDIITDGIGDGKGMDDQIDLNHIFLSFMAIHLYWFTASSFFIHLLGWLNV